jgi:hypothetical protein
LILQRALVEREPTSVADVVVGFDDALPVPQSSPIRRARCVNVSGGLRRDHGVTPTAWSMAGVAGAALVVRVAELTGGHELAFYVVAGVLTGGLRRWRVNVVRRARHHGTPHGVHR